MKDFEPGLNIQKDQADDKETNISVQGTHVLVNRLFLSLFQAFPLILSLLNFFLQSVLGLDVLQPFIVKRFQAFGHTRFLFKVVLHLRLRIIQIA